MAAALVGFYAGFMRCVGAEPPNISLATLPVAYYGSSYIEKTPQVYEMFSKMRIVVLMQQDGALMYHGLKADLVTAARAAEAGDFEQFDAKSFEPDAFPDE